MRDELWFIEFGRGAALPLTPEEAPADGEPVVPCAQGRVVIETARPAPPYFATCSTYRRQIMEQHLSSLASATTQGDVVPSTSAATVSHHSVIHHQRSTFIRSATLGPQSPALRPEDLRVKPWYATDDTSSASKDSPPAAVDQSSCPAYNQFYDLQDSSSNHKETTSSRGVDAVSTRTSSIESENPRASVPRKAYMDLSDAIAMLDETCPNPEASPLMTPRTPRTPLTPHPRNKRARSKSSDNSSNYSSERLNENAKPQEKERKRPFLKKIGISMTEDRPLLAKLAPMIMGKPYLEKIGPSRAVDKPFLEKIGSSRTLDKFIFDTPKSDKRKPVDTSSRMTIAEEPEKKTPKERRDEIRGFSTGERRKSGKNFLLKMYSFETEDLEDSSLAMKAPHRDPLRGASLDDVLDSGPSSMPRINELCAMTNSDIETPSVSVAELVKCRVTTSEEIISSNSCLNSPMEVISWGNSPRRRLPRKNHELADANKNGKENESVPNSPTKRAHSSITPEKVTAVYKDLDTVKNGRQISEDILDKRKSRHDDFERRGASSDNLTKERVVTPVFAEIGGKDLNNGKGSCNSVVSTSSSVKQLHDRFESQEIFTETYADFKRRTKGNLHTSNALKRLIVREKTISPSFDLGFSSKDAALEKMKSEGSPKVRSKSVENDRKSKDKLDAHHRRSRTRSVLRKQQGVDHSNYPNEPSDQETTADSSQRRKMVHEPSQETLDLLSELQKVKSLLKTPSIDKTYETELTELKPFPKRILLTDKEFCLSIERENSVRRPSRVNTLEVVGKPAEKNSETETHSKSADKGPALFEKRCLSLDYADDERSKAEKTEPRALSLASARSPRSEDILEASEIALITCDSKSYSSDVFNTPSDEANDKTIAGISVEKEVQKIENEMKMSSKDEGTKKTHQETTKKSNNALRIGEKIEKIDSTEDNKEVHEKTELKPNHCTSETTEPPQQVSPKKKEQQQTGGEVASPKATPFRMKKRLGRISVEETVKQESFAVTKVDCKEVAVQKRAKCLPL